jgi:hypothetical protein
LCYWECKYRYIFYSTKFINYFFKKISNPIDGIILLIWIKLSLYKNMLQLLTKKPTSNKVGFFLSLLNVKFIGLKSKQKLMALQ